jgi:chromosome segregation ATPase
VGRFSKMRDFTRKVRTEQKTFHSWLQDLDELSDVADDAERLAVQVPELQGEVAALQLRKTELEQSLQRLSGEVKTVADDVKEARNAGRLASLIQEREGRLATLDTDIAAKEADLVAVTAAFDKFKTEHKL